MSRTLLHILLIASAAAGFYLLGLLIMGDASWVTYANAGPVVGAGAALICIPVLVAGWVTVHQKREE